MRICILYDCLFPWTIGGAERWYRNLAERFAQKGHEVTFITLRQWDGGDEPRIPGVEVIAVGPRMALYKDERRRIWPPLRFGIGVFLHLLRHGRRYDYLHMASFPFFSLLAAATVKPFQGYSIAVDWHEVWSREYWNAYLGRLGGRVGWLVQYLCACVPQRSYSFSNLHAQRLAALAKRPVQILPGEYADHGARVQSSATIPRTVVYAGRMIPEKRVTLLVDALAILMAQDVELRASLFGRGPELQAVADQIARAGLSDRIALPGFVAQDVIDLAISGAAAIVQPSAREGYGMIVVEASAHGVPVVVVDGPDNAAVDLVDDGVNGYIAFDSSPEAIARAISSCLSKGDALRASTALWYRRNAERLSLDHSLGLVLNDLKEATG